MKKTLIIATRTGSLAMAQTQIVVSALQKLYPALDVRIKKITSEGDKDKRTTLWELKSTGFFTSKLEDALLAKQADPPKGLASLRPASPAKRGERVEAGEVSPKADVAVHSFKDLPTAQREGLSIAAVLDRRFPEDCLVSVKRIKSVDELPEGAKIGTSSLRRTVQAKRLREDLQCVPIRGNVTTRLKKLERGDFDAVILARAGLERLGLANKISIVFDPAQFIPAPAQGALAVQVRDDDTETKEIVSRLDEKGARITTTAERLVFSTLGCGCHAPAGVFAKITGKKITISAFYSDADGKNLAQSSLTGPVTNSETLAQSLAKNLLKQI
jgi:hydroxymethylbilane synthase